MHKYGVPGWKAPENREPTMEERAFLEANEQFRSHDLAYFGLQATKPQTIAYALQDSPVGLAAWLLEKWWRWIDHDDDLWSVVHRDTFLTTTTLYWLTGSVLSSLRIYYENREWRDSQDRARGPIVVPTGFAGFPGDPFTSAPRSLVVPGDYANIVYISEQPRGGHFAAMEQPQLWAEDVAAFFSRL